MSHIHYIHKPDRNWNRSALTGNDHTSLQQHCHDNDTVLCGCHIPLYHTYCSHKLQNMRKSWFRTFAMFWTLYAFFWVIPWCLKIICRCFGTNLKHKNLTSTIPWLTPTRTLSPSHMCPWPPCVSIPSIACFCTQTHPYPATLLPIGSGYFQAKHFPVQIPQHSQT